MNIKDIWSQDQISQDQILQDRILQDQNSRFSSLVKKYEKNTFDFAIRSYDIRPSDPQSLQRRMNILIIDPICRLHRKSLSRCNIPSYHLLRGIIQFKNINLVLFEKKLRNTFLFALFLCIVVFVTANQKFN